MSESRIPEVLDDYEDLLDDNEHPWRGRLIWLAVLGVLVAAGAYALWTFVLGGDGSSTAETQTATVERGSITNTISTTGTVIARSTSNLSFGQSGEVTAVNVTLGQEVKKGDVLAEIEADSLQDALTRAEVSLTSAQIKLNQLLEGADASELASADQSVLQAQANYDQAYRALQDLMDGPSDSERLSAEQNVSSAQSNLAKAQDSRAKLDTASEDAIAAAEEAVNKAEDALNDAEDAVDDAEDNVDLAEASLKSAETGYCLCPDYSGDPDAAVSFCTSRTAPISSADRAVLMDITVTGSPDLAKEASSVLAANTSYGNAVEAVERAEDAVDSAEEDLEAAEDSLDEAKAGPSAEEIASADAAIVSAQRGLEIAYANLVELNEGPTEDDLTQAQYDLDMAAASLTSAQAKRDDVYDGNDWEDIEQQRSQVQLAQLSVEQAQKDLEKAQLIAPFDGTVAEINIEVGEATGGSDGGSAIVLNTPNAIRISLTVTESDVMDLEVGQSGYATFDAIEDAMFPITIESIGTNATTTQGVVTFQAWASIETERLAGAAGMRPMGALAGSEEMPAATPAAGMPSMEEMPAATPAAGATPVGGATPAAGDGELPTDMGQGLAGVDTDAKPLPGMNATLTIIVDQAQDVLIVPDYAVQSEGRNSVVEVQKDDGTTEMVVVETGLSDGTNIEIVSGLEEGQTIIIPTLTATSTETTQETEFQQGGMPFPGGGPPGEGGGFGGGPQ